MRQTVAQWAGATLVLALAFAALPGDAQAGTAVAKADALVAGGAAAAAQDDVPDCFEFAHRVFDGCRRQGGSLTTCSRRSAEFFGRCVQNGDKQRQG